jgi:CheY-like chemotaxis protein
MTVLVVDDELAITETLSVALELAGYRPVSAANGREGLEQFERTRPDLVISDVMMPHLDGREMVRAIRRTPAGRQIPIILMSAAHDLGRDSTIGHDLFVAKPFDLDRLLQQVAELLASGRPGPR